MLEGLKGGVKVSRNWDFLQLPSRLRPFALRQFELKKALGG